MMTWLARLLAGTTMLGLASGCGDDGLLLATSSSDPDGSSPEDATGSHPPDAHDATPDASHDAHDASKDARVAPSDANSDSATCLSPGTETPGTAFWAQPLAGIGKVSSMATDPSGNLVLGGAFSGTLTIGGTTLMSDPNGPGAFFAKLDAAGHLLFAKDFGDAPYFAGSGPSIGVDGDGNIVLAGSFEGTINLGTTAATQLSSPEEFAGFLAKLDPSGNLLWIKSFGDATADVAAGSVSVDPSGDFVVAGAFSGTVDFAGGADGGAGVITAGGSGAPFVAKFTSAGDWVWSRTFEVKGDLGPSADIFDQAVDPAGNIYEVGQFVGSIDFTGQGADAGASFISNPAPYAAGYVAKLDANGGYLWSIAPESNADSTFAAGLATSYNGGASGLLSVAVDRMGHVAVYGYVDGATVNLPGFDGGLSGGGSYDGGQDGGSGGFVRGYVAGLDPEAGAFTWSWVLGQGSGGTARPSLAFDPAGNLFVGSSIINPAPEGGNDGGAYSQGIIVARLDPQGSPVWSRTFGGYVGPSNQDSDCASAIAIDSCGSELFVGGSVNEATTLPSAEDGGTVTLNGGSLGMFVSRLAK